MLCAFANIRDLDRCRAAAVDSSEDIMVYHARRSGTNRTLISCILPQLNEGAGADLRSHFPTVSNDMVREVWENGEGWGVCFDTLKTLQASAGAQGVLVDNCSFLWDTVSWPPLNSSSKEILKNADWEIYEIQTLAEALSELDIAKSDPSDGWEVVNTTGSDGGGGNSSIAAAPAPGPVTRGTVRNYREALLKAPAAKPASHADGEGARKRVATAASWKPAIVVKELKYEHKDKVYQHNLIEQGIDPNALYVEEDEGGYDGGSFFQSNDYAKGSVSLNRMRAATMLRPAALEKKMSRIAAREALRPPPPVSSTAESDGAGARTRAARVAAARAISNSAGPEDAGDSDGYTSD